MQLDPHKITLLISYGGHAADKIFAIAKALERCNAPIQAIFLSGHNKKLHEKLSRLDTRYPKVVLSFSENVVRYYQLANIFIGKLGGSSTAEAIHMRLPMLLELHKLTMGQEKNNAAWVLERNLGRSFKNIRQLVKRIDEIANPQTLQNFQITFQQVTSAAFHAIPTIIHEIIQTAESNTVVA